MSNWETKSESNLKASNKLLLDSLHNESVHCSYYGCVQYVFHLFYVYFGMDVPEVEMNSQSSVNKMGTHNWLKKEIYNSIKVQKNRRIAQSLYDDIGSLCNARVRADYKHEILEPEEAQKVLDLAHQTISTLKSVYNT